MNLFAYGTLMCAEIMQQVAGCLPVQAPATLAEYRRCQIRGEEYPAIVGQPNSFVQAVVYLDLPEEAWPRLDRFEGEMYARCVVHLHGADGRKLEAEAYVIRPEFAHLLVPEEWSYAEFLRSGRQRFSADYAGFAVLEKDQGTDR